MLSNTYSHPTGVRPGPRRLPALAFFTIGELIFVSLDPMVALMPAVTAFLLGAMALTAGRG